MTYEKEKKLLQNYSKLRKWINDFEIDLEEIREKLDKHCSVNASVISDMPRGTDVSDKTFDKVCRIDELKEEYIKQANYTAKNLRKFYKDKRTVEEIYQELNPTQQFIIEKRYFDRLNWDDVAELDTQKRTKRMILNEHGKMLNIISKKLKEGD